MKKMQEVLIVICQVFIQLFNDLMYSIMNSNKKYHWLVGTFLHMLINSIIPL